MMRGCVWGKNSNENGVQKLKKNDEIRLTIEDMGVNGEGIGKYDGMPFFVPKAVIGDRIVAGITKLKKHYGYARLIAIEEPSADRVRPRCPLAGSCGGCSLMHLSYEKQLLWKEAQVENDLRRIGGIPEDILKKAKRPVIGMEDPYHFRNKSQYPVGADKDGNTVVGFYAAHSHRIVPVEDCRIAQPMDMPILRAVLKYMDETGVGPYDETTGRGLLRHILIRHGLRTGEIMVCLVVNGESLPKAEILIGYFCGLRFGDEALDITPEDMLYKNAVSDPDFDTVSSAPHIASIVLNANTRRDNVILGTRTKVLWGKERIRDELLGNTFSISARSFYQVNPLQTERLYMKAVEYAGLTGKETVWDLYCGIGTISLCMARDAKRVVGIEVVPEAVRDAGENARLNAIKNVSFVEGKAEDIVAAYGSRSASRDTKEKHPEVSKKANFGKRPPFALPDPDVIVVDPPRKGLDEITIRAMLSAAPDRIVYVSCNPSTLARDVKLLRDGGYELVEYTPVDQFGHSWHVETVVLLTKQNT